MVPIVDGRRVYQIAVNLKEAYDTNCQALVKAFQKQIILHVIDESWKENLRQLDELKHSSQNASYEQKDPLLIYKLESAKIFDEMVNRMNNRTVSILMRGQIPVIEQQGVHEAPAEQRPRQQYTENRSGQAPDPMTDPAQRAAAMQDTRNVQPTQPIKVDKMPGRNDPCPCGSGKKFKNCHGRGL